MTLDGTYKPNRPGARTLAEARPLYVGDDLVTAQVYTGDDWDRYVAIFVGVKLVHEGHLPAEITHPGQVNPFVQRFIADRALAG